MFNIFFLPFARDLYPDNSISLERLTQEAFSKDRVVKRLRETLPEFIGGKDLSALVNILVDRAVERRTFASLEREYGVNSSYIRRKYVKALRCYRHNKTFKDFFNTKIVEDSFLGDSYERKGLFIVFEGLDFSGKSTQLSLLGDFLKEFDKEAVFIQEPGGSPLGEYLRRYLLDNENDIFPLAETLLFAANRAENLQSTIVPALKEGKVVVSSRYIDSSFAYQGAKGVSEPFIRDIHKGFLITPDITVLLDSGPVSLYNRGDEKDRLESFLDTCASSVYSNFMRKASEDPLRYIVVNARNFPDVIASNIREELLRRFPYYFFEDRS